MPRLAIGDVAKRCDVRASTLRFYEERRLLPTPMREGGRRVYDPEILDRLAVIELAKRSGFTIGEIASLLRGLDGPRPAADSWRRMAAAKLAELDHRIEQAQSMKGLLVSLAECECATLKDCGSTLNAKRGWLAGSAVTDTARVG